MCFSAANIGTDMLRSLSKDDFRAIWRMTHEEDEVTVYFNIVEL